MKTLKDFIDKIHASDRITQDMTKKEAIECLDIIAQDMMSGKSTLLHANTILAIRHGMMSASEQKADYSKNENELLAMSASALGKKGGSSTSDAKKKSSADNLARARAEGKKGGRPRSDNPVRKRPYHKKEE